MMSNKVCETKKKPNYLVRALLKPIKGEGEQIVLGMVLVY